MKGKVVFEWFFWVLLSIVLFAAGIEAAFLSPFIILAAPAPLMMLWGGASGNAEALRYADALSRKNTAFELSWTKNREESLSTASLRGYKWWIDLGGRRVTQLPGGREISLNEFESEVLSC